VEAGSAKKKQGRKKGKEKKLEGLAACSAN